MTDGAVEREGGEGWIEMGEASTVIVSPYMAVIGIDGEGVDSVK